MNTRKTEEFQLGLGPMVQAIRNELEAIDRERRSAASPALFRLGQVTVELKCVAKETSEDGFSLGLKVIGFEDKEEYQSERVHTVTLHLHAIVKADQSNTSENPMGSLLKQGRNQPK